MLIFIRNTKGIVTLIWFYPLAIEAHALKQFR
jgi:hypothetical protein